MTATNILVARPDSLLAGPLGSFEAYADRISRIPVLSRDQEQELATRFRRDNDLEAARGLVMSHLRFVLHIARGYSGYGLPIGDLVGQCGAGGRREDQGGYRPTSHALLPLRLRPVPENPLRIECDLKNNRPRLTSP